MSVKILMPALSPTMEKGNLAKWLKNEGDQVKSGDILAEIETDKATMEVEAVDEGVLAKILVPAGTADVPVNDLIAILAEEGEDVAAAIAAATSAAPASASSASASSANVSSASTAAIPATQATASPTPAAAPVAQLSHMGRVFSSPLARRLAKEAGIDIATVKGTGPHGRVIERDVQAAISGGTAKAATAPQTAAAPKSAALGDDAIKKLFAADSYEEIPHDNMRKTIARRLVESKQTVPHFYLTVDTELDALLALREQINAAAPKDKDGKPAYKVSVNDFVIKAQALALRQVPDANVSWSESAMLRHKVVDIGVAVSIPGGLITPVIRNADVKTLSAISNEMKDLAGRARNRKLRPDEYQGGSTAVSNLGMFGIKDFSAIINPPHATILAVGAGEKRVVVKGDAPAVATVMTVTLSTDHRAVDGALGAQLLAAFKALIENPIGLLV